MRVLLVSNGYPPRGNFGTEFYTRELAQALAARGHELAVLHPERSGARARYALERVEVAGIPVFLLHNPGDPRKRFATSHTDPEVERVFDELLARERADIVHFNYLLWGLSLGLPARARARGIPSVATLTDYGLLCHRAQMFDATLRRCGGPHAAAVCARCVRSPSAAEHALPLRLARRWAAELLALGGGFERVPVAADLRAREHAVRAAWDALARLIAPTAHLLEVFARAGAPREKLVPLLYAFDERHYRPRPRAPGGRARFGFLGQFAPHKGLHTLLAAARELARLEPTADWELVLYGQASSGRHRRYARQCLANLDARHVRLAAPFAPHEAPRVLAELTALVAPSEWDENAPLAVLQARAAGLPVIATDVPGIAEIVPVPAGGELVAVGDAAALARAMQRALHARAGAAVAAGLPLALDEHARRLEELYAEVRKEARVAL
jgi:glycosyltransferase involved in cell wall biosynthesis